MGLPAGTKGLERKSSIMIISAGTILISLVMVVNDNSIVMITCLFSPSVPAGRPITTVNNCELNKSRSPLHLSDSKPVFVDSKVNDHFDIDKLEKKILVNRGKSSASESSHPGWRCRGAEVSVHRRRRGCGDHHGDSEHWHHRAEVVSFLLLCAAGPGLKLPVTECQWRPRSDHSVTLPGWQTAGGSGC